MSAIPYGCIPDYDGGSIVNVLASLIRGAGGETPHKDCVYLPSDSLSSHRHITYVVIDGLGEYQLSHYLKQQPNSPFFGKYGHEVIDTVFPATTAAAVTTFATGSSPKEHGVLSWYLHLADLGGIATILMSQTRTGLPLIPADMDWKAYLKVPDYVGTVPRPRIMLSYDTIPNIQLPTLEGKQANPR